MGNERDCQIQVRADAIGKRVSIKQYSERLERFGAHLEEVVYQRRASSGNVRRGLFPVLKEFVT
jgi:hypothetical protein